MSRTKRRKSSVKLEEKESTQKSKKTKVQRIMTFDVYFQGLLRRNNKIAPHHKAPMRAYAEGKGLITGTLEEFDKIFSGY